MKNILVLISNAGLDFNKSFYDKTILGCWRLPSFKVKITVIFAMCEPDFLQINTYIYSLGSLVMKMYFNYYSYSVKIKFNLFCLTTYNEWILKWINKCLSCDADKLFSYVCGFINITPYINTESITESNTNLMWNSTVYYIIDNVEIEVLFKEVFDERPEVTDGNIDLIETYDWNS